MAIHSKLFLAALLFGSMATPALAGSFYASVSPPPPDDLDSYWALDVGQSKIKDNCAASLASGLSGCKDTASLYRVGYGYQISPMWGMEISYGAYGKASKGTSGSQPVNDWQIKGLQLSGLVTFPIAYGFSLTGKLGLAQTDIKLSGTSYGTKSLNASSTKLAYGIGAQYDFTKRVSARAQYENLGEVGDSSTGIHTVTLLTGGIVYKF